MVDGDKTRRKRLKVVSACGECRRKKTKCNGEKPCAGCLKAHVECKYVTSQKTSASAITAANATASAANATTTLSAPVSNTSTKTANTAKSQKMIHPPTIETSHEHTMLNNASLLTSAASTAPSSSTSTSTLHSHPTASSIESIEERLGTIENILRALLGSGKNKHLLQGFHPQQQQQQQQRSESSVYMDPKPPHYYGHHPHYHSDVSSSSNTSTSSSSCGDMYSSPHLVHAPHIQNRPKPREKRQRHEEDEEGMTENKRLNVRDDFGHGDRQHQQHPHPYSKLQLAPIKIINHTPGTPTTSIRNLLNEQTDEDQHLKKKPRWYPTSASSTSTSTTNSAFYRMSSLPRNEIINSNNSATTAAGNFT
ncbi:uncharacterized protein ATC70_008528 [Mucor velutinosus]|uniref:Zn(2)-C6 fungal-type domain-containing protein n=1 Tax=Mucor velutinosus TaxID=708070 RepID=A0AAN7DPH6_9FUNG|nr:hypothetical protein ATC70_008528 [Mucor velutinosus]